MEEASLDRERLILERILALKQMLEHGGGPLELHELGVLYFHLDNFRQAATYLTDLEDRYPDYIETGSAAALRALCLVKAGDLEAACALLEKRLNIDNTDTRLFNMLAFAQEKSGHVDKAIETHRTVLRLDPDNAGSLNGLGYLLTIRGGDADKAEAARCLKAAVSMKPESPAYLDSFGVLLAKMGNQAAAEKAFEKALLRAPNESEILDHLKELRDSVKG